MAFNDLLCQSQLDYFNASLSKREFWAMRSKQNNLVKLLNIYRKRNIYSA